MSQQDSIYVSLQLFSSRSKRGRIPPSHPDFVFLYFPTFHLIIRHLSFATMKPITAQTLLEQLGFQTFLKSAFNRRHVRDGVVITGLFNRTLLLLFNSEKTEKSF